jgi:hypothetical protein
MLLQFRLNVMGARVRARRAHGVLPRVTIAVAGALYLRARPGHP